ncbi:MULTISPECIES: hypothetical protein [Maribacter]|uniref:Uncharacterized protein n=1 Tax=Maribacter flavus TaxID=1658664 RepID=A0A5B2U144_9FLAO|nr:MULTISPECIES: hypothetical protein [Maribacter]KAA2219750.1 hypothetical protein F0361_09215 [Maribacter flavus]MDC6405335.1 hypothetical protein [Maribacter sp. PR66]MEE1971856.1 hypothetical protein [Maribacter flavus]
MYKDKTDKELLEVLEQYSQLTFESQLSLKDEISTRGLIADTSELDAAIEDKISRIKNFEFLKDFGFKAETTNTKFLVTRTLNATLTDVFAVILGLIIFFLGVNGVVNLIMTFVNGDEIDVFTLAVKFAMAGLVFVGIKFFSGLKRLFDYSGFELARTDGDITLKKRFDIKLEEIRAKASDLFLDREEDELELKLGNQVIFSSNAENLVQRMTLEELTKRLKGN